MGGGSSGGSFSIPDSNETCEALFIECFLSNFTEPSSPISVGDKLLVVLRDGELGAPYVQTQGGERVGAVSAIAQKLKRLQDCMLQGYAYVATVEQMQAPMCKVAITIGRA